MARSRKSNDFEARPSHPEHTPGTPDVQVAQARFAGRQARRHDLAFPNDPIPDSLACPARGTSGRVDWWLGWFDVGLERFYPEVA